MSKSIFDGIVTLETQYQIEETINKVINGKIEKKGSYLYAVYETGVSMLLSSELSEVVKPGTIFTAVKVIKYRFYKRTLTENNKEIWKPTEDCIWRVISLY